MDLIKRKLEQIDFRLELGPAYLVRQIVESAPLVLPAAAIIIGILVRQFINLSALLWLFLVISSAASALIYITFRRTQSNIYIIACLAFFCSMGLGAIRLNSYRQLPANDISNIIKDRSLATIRGSIITEPYTSDTNDWLFSKFRITELPSSFYLNLSEAEGKNGWINISGRVRVQVSQPVINLKAGDYVQIYCWLERLKPATNPGEFDLAAKLADENIFIAAAVDSRDAIEVLSHQHKLSFFQINKILNNAASYALRGESDSQDQSKNLIEGLILGSRYKIDEQTITAFRKTGLLHFLSLSGLNFVIMIAFVWWLSKFTGLGKKGQALICIAVSVLFIMAVPSNPPVLRAAVISLIFCASFFFSRQPNSFNSLALSAIILLFFRPVDLFNASWQLSFATTLGILLFFRHIQLFLYENIVPVFKQVLDAAKLSFVFYEKFLFSFSSLFSMGIAAWLGGAGIMLYHFNTITPLTSIWTCLASPLVSAITIIGLIKIILNFILPPIAAFLGILAAFLSNLLIWLVKLFAKINISEILFGQVPLKIILFYYCVLFFVAFCLFRKPLLRKIISISLILILAISIFAVKFQKTYRNNLVLSCLDVSHGQSILLQPPGTANLIFDAGSLYKSNIGRRIIFPFLRSQAITNLDALIISHDDIDHINAIPEVISSINTKFIYADESFSADSKKTGPVKLLSDFLTSHGYKITNSDNLQIHPPATIKILWPPDEPNIVSYLSANDKSEVWLIDFAGVKILLCSDIEKFAQQKILQIYPDLKADIVVAPHHGSTATADEHFIESLSPKFIIFSSGQAQYEKQMKLSNNSAVKLFTFEDGFIRICVSSKGEISFSTGKK